ncbi:MAG: carboxypeptidase-like regulatory domain-containing protein [Hymenobacter sp.]|nr:MAG: carboxypeptidase-like regulatory domain-containing protein [Hymenobacter sp.]
MKYAFLLPVAFLGLLPTQPLLAQTTRPASATTSQDPSVPVQLACRSFSGHVMASTGSPLVGATILIKGTYVARTTNEEGYFTFDLPAPPTQAPHLLVSSAGFAPQDFLITSCAPLNVELQILDGTKFKKRGKHKGFIKQTGKE